MKINILKDYICQYLESFCHIESDTVRQNREGSATLSCQLPPVSHLFPVGWGKLAHVKDIPISSTNNVSHPIDLTQPIFGLKSGRYFYNQDCVPVNLISKNQAHYLLRSDMLDVKNNRLNSLKRQGLGGFFFKKFILLLKKPLSLPILRSSKHSALYQFGGLS